MDVIVDVIDAVIVIALVNGNDTLIVIGLPWTIRIEGSTAVHGCDQDHDVVPVHERDHDHGVDHVHVHVTDRTP